MQRSSTKFLALVSVVFACGSPGELDESQFPVPGMTGYPEDRAGAGGMPTAAAGSGGSSALPLGGTGGSAGTGGSGTGGSGTGGGAGSAGQGGTAATGSCPDDIAVLFNRPGSEGGCEGMGCHVPGGQTPDLTSPDVASRLLDVISTCNGRPYISASDSFLENKLVGNPPDCGGFPMPFFMTAALSAADKQCMLEWIDEVAAGM
jgi:hypothetical protein